MERIHIEEIRDEYKKIDEKWLHLHFKAFFWLVIFVVIVECLMSVVLYRVGEIHSSLPRYLFKYLFAPFLFNMVFIIIDYTALYIMRLSLGMRIYIVSMMGVFNCFVIYSVHIMFSNLYFIFVIPILLTMVYANLKLTGITAAVSIVSVVISEMFIEWDSEKINIFENSDRLINFMVSLCVLVALSAVCLLVLRFEKKKNEASIQKEMERYKLKQKINTDALTKIQNRAALQAAFKGMERDMSGNRYIFSLLDLDCFKELNDSLGHIAGDSCLQGFGAILQENCGDATPFRYGGDEFCILFCNNTMEEAVEVCRRIQEELRRLELDTHSEMVLTASFGLCRYSRQMDTSVLLANADKALYVAKEKRNAIRVYEELS